MKFKIGDKVAVIDRSPHAHKDGNEFLKSRKIFKVIECDSPTVTLEGSRRHFLHKRFVLTKPRKPVTLGMLVKK